MKKLFSLLVLLMIHITAFGQEESRVAIGFQVSPDVASYSTAAFQLNHKAAKLSYSDGLFGLFTLSPQWTLQVGIGYANEGSHFNWEPLRFGTPPDPESPVAIKTVYSHHFLEVPVDVNYYITNGNTRLFLSGGFAFNLAFGQTNKLFLQYRDGSVATSNSPFSLNRRLFRPFTVGMQAGFGIDQKLTDQWVLRIQPEVRHDLTSYRKPPESPSFQNPVVRSYFYSAGLNIGIIRKL